MKNVLYIGNQLSNNRSNLSSINILGPLLEQEGFNLKYASKYTNKTRRLLDMLWACIKYRNQTDLIIIDTYSTQNFHYALLVSQLCRILKLSYIPRLNGGNLPQRLEQSPRLSRAIFKNAYKLVSPSIYLKEAFEAYGYQNIQYIPNSLELKFYEFHEKKHEVIKLLWVRSFAKIYNPELAIQVLKALQDQGITASLCMVGPDSDGSMKAVKKLATDLGVSVKFTGKLPKKDWLALAKDYNVFINTTNFDNMPVSVIEAMALGLPVVSTNVGGLPFLISDTIDGLLVAPESVGAMANAIIELKTDEALRTKLVINARAKVENFSWETVRHQWTRLLS